MHVKDCRLSVARQGQAEGWHYRQTVVAGLWAEPGRGPDITDPFDSAVASASWMRTAFG